MEQLSPRCVLFKFNGGGREIQLQGSFEYEWDETVANNGGGDKRQAAAERKASFLSAQLIQLIHHLWTSLVGRKHRHARGALALPTASVRPHAHGCSACVSHKSSNDTGLVPS